MADKITVLALVRAKPGLEETVRRELEALVAPTRAEEGCLGYVLHRSCDDPARFMFYENWRSRADLDKHLAMPYLQALLAKADDLMAESPDIRLWELIA